MLKMTFNNLKPINTRLIENKIINVKDVKGDSCILKKTKELKNKRRAKKEQQRKNSVEITVTTRQVNN